MQFIQEKFIYDVGTRIKKYGCLWDIVGIKFNKLNQAVTKCQKVKK